MIWFGVLRFKGRLADVFLVKFFDKGGSFFPARPLERLGRLLYKNTAFPRPQPWRKCLGAWAPGPAAWSQGQAHGECDTPTFSSVTGDEDLLPGALPGFRASR